MKRRGKPAQAGLVMDNQPTTYWHTKWQGDNPTHPHMIVLDLGKVQKLSGFQLPAAPEPGKRPHQGL